MKNLIIISLIIGIMLITLVTSADYVAPSYTNVTIVLPGSYTAPAYTNVTIVLNPTSGAANCWTTTNNIIYIPQGCVYSKTNGVSA